MHRIWYNALMKGVIRMMYSIKQICELFQVSKRTVMTWIKEGKVHPVKVANKWMFNQDEVNRMMKEGVS